MPLLSKLLIARFFCNQSRYIRITLNATNRRIAVTEIVRTLTEKFGSTNAFFLTDASFPFDSKIPLQHCRQQQEALLF